MMRCNRWLLLAMAVYGSWIGTLSALAEPTITVIPGAMGAPVDSFVASFVGFSDTSSLDQTGAGTFSERGRGAFSNFFHPDLDTVIAGTGLNTDSSLSAQFTA